MKREIMFLLLAVPVAALAGTAPVLPAQPAAIGPARWFQELEYNSAFVLHSNCKTFAQCNRIFEQANRGGTASVKNGK